MASSSNLKELFEVESKHKAFFTGGHIEWYNDIFYCQSSSNINLFNSVDGVISNTVGEEYSEDADFIQVFTTDGTRIISSHKSGLLKLWNNAGELEKTWKYIHRGPISSLYLRGNHLASGGSDGAVRIWDIEHHSCILSLKGCQGVINVLEYHPVEDDILASGDDGKILQWELKNGELRKTYQSHYSKVTSLVFTHDNTHFISCGRDKVMILWKFMDDTPLKSIPFYEAVDSIISLPKKFKVPGFTSDPESYYIASAGEKGIIRIWDVKNVKEVYVQDNSLVSPAQEGNLAILKLLFDSKTKTLAVVTVEHNIILHHLKSFACMRQFIGSTDEIFDIAFMGENDEYLAVANNSSDIKLYENTTMNCQILKGHTDIVLSLSVSKINRNLLLSSSKDNTIRLWLCSIQVECIGIGKRHTASVGTCCFSQITSQWAVTAGLDFCVKLWDIPNTKNDEIVSLSCTKTEVAHQKEINCVAVAPNDKIIGTASQDKTAKLWNENLGLIGVLRGHKRGVWCIRFSPVDQVAVTSSADCSIKLWNVKDLSCLTTLIGHYASVLKIEIISNGYQILSSGGDGHVKIFNIKDEKCQLSLEEHNGKVWAIAVKTDESMIVTGDSDSSLIKWTDATEKTRLEKVKEEEERILEEQKLNNYLQNGKLLKALKLAINLDKPFRVLLIVKELIKKGEKGLKNTIEQLRDDHKNSLLTYAANWNTQKKNHLAAQLLIEVLGHQIQNRKFPATDFPTRIMEIIPYTQKYFDEEKTFQRNMHFVAYCMRRIKNNII